MFSPAAVRGPFATGTSLQSFVARFAVVAADEANVVRVIWHGEGHLAGVSINGIVDSGNKQQRLDFEEVEN